MHNALAAMAKCIDSKKAPVCLSGLRFLDHTVKSLYDPKGKSRAASPWMRVFDELAGPDWLARFHQVESRFGASDPAINDSLGAFLQHWAKYLPPDEAAQYKALVRTLWADLHACKKAASSSARGGRSAPPPTSPVAPSMDDDEVQRALQMSLAPQDEEMVALQKVLAMSREDVTNAPSPATEAELEEELQRALALSKSESFSKNTASEQDTVASLAMLPPSEFLVDALQRLEQEQVSEEQCSLFPGYGAASMADTLTMHGWVSAARLTR